MDVQFDFRVSCAMFTLVRNTYVAKLHVSDGVVEGP